MKKFIFLIIIVQLSFVARCVAAQDNVPPNVVILYADDLGWSDLGCYGSTVNESPNLDKLVSEGVKFTNAYAPAPICSASRASMMTGKSPAKLNFEFVATQARVTDKPLLPPKRTLELPLEEISLGEVASAAGYSTAFFGKWHIAKHNGGYLKWSDTHGPLQQGFKVGSDDFGSHPYNKVNRKAVSLPEGEFPEDSLVLKAVDFLKSQQQNKEEPFFIIFSSYYVHTPVIPNNSWLIEKYKKRMPGATDAQVKYAAFVETMDHYFGQILKALREYNMEENTIVIFTSDNGGHPKYTDNTPLKGNKWNLYEGGIREPLIVKWPGVFEKNVSYSEPVIQWDIMPTLCDIFGQPYPDSIDGESLFALLKGEVSSLERESIYWHFPYYHPPKSYEGTKPCSAIRKGKYKLIYFYEDKHAELYDLKKDMAETTDLSSQLPKITKELKELLLENLQNANARFAIPNPKFSKRQDH